MSGHIAACFVVENRRNAFIYNIIARLKTRCAERLSIAEFRINYTVAGQGHCEVAGWIFMGNGPIPLSVLPPVAKYTSVLWPRSHYMTNKCISLVMLLDVIMHSNSGISNIV